MLHIVKTNSLRISNKRFCIGLFYPICTLRYQSTNTNNTDPHIDTHTEEIDTLHEDPKESHKQTIAKLEANLQTIRAREQAYSNLVRKLKYGIESDTPNTIEPEHETATTATTTNNTNINTNTTDQLRQKEHTKDTAPRKSFFQNMIGIFTKPETPHSKPELPHSDAKTVDDLLLEIRDFAPPLYDIMKWPDTRISKESTHVIDTLVHHDAVFVKFLRTLYDMGHYRDVQAYFEKFGVNNYMQGEAPILYLSAISKDSSTISTKIIKMFKEQPLGANTNPLHVYLPISRVGMGLSIITILISLGILIVLWMAARGGGGISNMLNITYKPIDNTKFDVTFKDVKGNHEAKEELKDLVEYLKDPQKFATVKVPKGILMVGPPGTGKTLIARALAGEAGVPFITASGSEFEEVFVGLGARRIRQLFEDAKRQAPCIIFIDEIDAVGGSREKFFRNQQMSLNQLLVELDGFNSRDGIILIGATNLPSALDPALIRPGRFDRKIYLGLPDPTERQEILEYYLSKHKLADDVDASVMARQTAGMAGADIENMVNWAALEAIKQELPSINMTLLEVALMNEAMGREKKSMLLSDKVKKVTAYHEGGHALVALYASGAPEIRKATLIPRGQALGMVNYLPKDEHLVTKMELIGQMQMAMGGRAAEELIFGKDEITTGASSDFEGATNLAYMMVTKFGMSEEIGHVYINKEPGSFRFKGNAEIIEKEVQRLLEEAYRDASKLLKERESELHLLATALLQYETLDKHEILQVIKGEPLLEKDARLKIEKAEKAQKEENKKQKEKAQKDSHVNEVKEAMRDLKLNLSKSEKEEVQNQEKSRAKDSKIAMEDLNRNLSKSAEVENNVSEELAEKIMSRVNDVLRMLEFLKHEKNAAQKEN